MNIIKVLGTLCLCATLACTFSLNAMSWGDPMIQIDHDLVKNINFKYIESADIYRSEKAIEYSHHSLPDGAVAHFYLEKIWFGTQYRLYVIGISKGLPIYKELLSNVEEGVR